MGTALARLCPPYASLLLVRRDHSLAIGAGLFLSGGSGGAKAREERAREFVEDGRKHLAGNRPSDALIAFGRALAEGLLMSGAYADALTVTEALSGRANTAAGMGRDACRQALDQLGESMAMRESVALIGDVDEENWAAMKAVIDTIGVSSVEALKSVITVEKDDLTTGRAENVIFALPKELRSGAAPGR